MKKILILILISLSVKVFGQVHLIGIQSGLNLTNQSSEYGFDNTEYRIGFVGGFNYEFLLKDKFSLSADLLYSQQGFKENLMFTDNLGNPISGNSSDKFYYDYLGLPIKFGYVIGDRFRIVPKIGFVPSYLLKAVTIIPRFDSKGDETIDVKDRVSKYDLAGLLDINLGYVIFDKYELFTSVLYRYSLTTFSNKDYFNDSKLRHYGLSFSLGLRCKIK